MKHALAILSIIASPTPVLAAQSQMQIVLNLSGTAERHLSKYECVGEDALREVEYVNADPNYLAILTLEEKQIIFTSVIAASGVRYVSGVYAWWTKGAEASLYDETRGEDPITTCLEASQTP